MYQVNKDTPLDAKLIKKAIDYNEKRRTRFDTLDDYYMGKQAITTREKVETLMNNKLVTNHAKYITDMMVGYLLGNPVDYQVNDGINIQPVLDAYKRQTMENTDVEIAKECSIFGIKYEYIYADEEANPCSVTLDVRNTIMIYDDTLVHNELYAINYRPIYKNPEDKEPDHYDVIVATDKEIIKYELAGNGGNAKEIDREQHAFGAVPIIEYDNNKEYSGDFESVISLIDAYNLIQSDRVNDREQLVDAILCFYGMKFDADQMADLKEKRALSNIPTDGKVEYLTKAINEGDVDVLRKTIEKDIHKISMVPDMSDEKFAGDSSGVAIRYKLLAFEQAVKNKERFFEKGLMKRFELYSHFLSVKSKMKEVSKEDVDAVFKRNLPSNDYETSQMIVNLDGIVDRELLASQLSFVKDASETIEIAEKEDSEAIKDDDYNANEFGNNVDESEEDVNE
ncbi:phage portal protein [Candidatus Saccharibacteria bacterium]|nr:phage portal protein [Candidatus Saccharibacteria bacterium]